MQRFIKKFVLTSLILVVIAAPAHAVNINYMAHMVSSGWLNWMSNGQTSGNTKLKQSMDAINIRVTEGGVTYRAYNTNSGWQNWVKNGATAGNTGKKQPLEAIEIKLADGLQNNYSVEYRVRLVKGGWQNWVKDGQTAGITGKNHKIDAVEIRLSAKIKTKNGNVNASNSREEYVNKVRQFLNDSRWRPGTSWGARKKPTLSPWNCIGCMAYAADFAKFVFGKNSPRDGVLFKNPQDIRAGDIFCVSSPHWVVVLARSGNNLETIEGNWPNDKGVRSVVRSKKAYTISGNNIMRNGKKYSSFASGWHFR